MRGDDPLDSASKLTWALRKHVELAPEKMNWVVEKVEGTIDNAIYKALEEKHDFDDKLVGVDNIMEILG